MDQTALTAAIAAMLSRAGFATIGLSVAPCAGGGNNRVFRVDAGGRAMAAKCYFRHPSDARDRLNSEYAFLEYARRAGIGCVPRVVARDDQAGIALYDFVAGSRLRAGSLSTSLIEQAQVFFLSLNGKGARAQGGALPAASEACFTITEQLQLVQGRIDRLAAIPANARIDEEAIAFTGILRSRWAALCANVLDQAARLGIDPDLPLADPDRCISPSDFGFHNAIVTPAGKIIFIDFEYAGWDDPAKAISDFFCQPAVPVPFECFDGFLAAALKYSENRIQLSLRTRLLFPVFRIKWCCIVMNDFLPLFGQRRVADPAVDVAARKQLQLDKAHRLLDTTY